MEASRPTTLSMLKSSMGGSRNDGTKDKIAMMEAKLRQMEQSKSITYSSSSTAPPLSSHPSLPIKPLSSFATSDRHRLQMSRGTPSQSQIKPKARRKAPLPSLPILPPTGDSQPSSLSFISQSYAAGTDHESRSEKHTTGQHKSTMSGLVGVRIGRPKDRAGTGKASDIVKAAETHSLEQ